jgi:acetolactate synthase-1/2/3 large subunit
MNGAESLVGTLVEAEIRACFTNPGTSEMHLVAALDKRPEIRCVLGLFEGVVTAAADGYARMARKPACTLLHLGPGLANGVANLHNASRAQVPLLNIVGQHATHHLAYDSPLKSDIEAIARPYSSWLKTARAASGLGRDAVDALLASLTPPGEIATLIVPADVAWSEGGIVEKLPLPPRANAVSGQTVDRIAAMFRSKVRTAILLSGGALYGEGLAAASRVAAAANIKLFSPYPLPRIERGFGKAVVDRIPYVHEQAVDELKEFRQLILVGAAAPVAYFASPGKNPALIPTECKIETLATPKEDCVGALDDLAAALSANKIPPVVEKRMSPPLPSGAITPSGLANAVASLLPENCIVVDESMTSGRGMLAAARGASPHDWLGNTGGSIGIALPLAVGAAVACPDRRVLCLSADGSAMYTVQGLWSMAREALPITTVIFANHSYSVLKREFSNLGVGDPGSRALDLFEIGRPDLDWVSLAKSMGIPGTKVLSLDAFNRALKQSFETEGPTLIEVPL